MIIGIYLCGFLGLRETEINPKQINKTEDISRWGKNTVLNSESHFGNIEASPAMVGRTVDTTVFAG